MCGRKKQTLLSLNLFRTASSLDRILHLSGQQTKIIEEVGSNDE